MCYLFILLLQLSSLLFIRLFVVCSGVVPHLSQFLCNISNGQTRMFSFDFWTKLRAEQEKSRTTEENKRRLFKFQTLLQQQLLWPLLLFLKIILEKAPESETDIDYNGRYQNWMSHFANSTHPCLLSNAAHLVPFLAGSSDRQILYTRHREKL